MGIKSKINLICALSKNIGNALRKQKHNAQQENVFLQFAHHLFDGNEYCMDGDIPVTVTQGMANTFRRYGAHLSAIVKCHGDMDSDYFNL